MARSMWIVQTGLIGMAVPEDLMPLVSAAAEFRFDLKRLPPLTFQKLLNVVRQGFTTEESGIVMSVLELVKAAHNNDAKSAPALPRISYVGKKTLTIYTLPGHGKRIGGELKAYGQMRDCNYDRALRVYDSRVHVDGGAIHVDTSGKSRKERKAAHLQTQFPGVMPLARNWCAETVAEREELIDFLVPCPTVTLRLIRKHEGEKK